MRSLCSCTYVRDRLSIHSCEHAGSGCCSSSLAGRVLVNAFSL